MLKKFKTFKRRFNRAHAAKIKALKGIHQHPVMIPVVTLLVLTMISLGIFTYINGGHTKLQPITSYIVIISHDHAQQTVPTKGGTVSGLLVKLGIRLNPGDVVEPDPATIINQDDFRINIYRAVPVEILDAGNVTHALSAATTSRAVAQQAGVQVYPEDKLVAQPVTNILTQGTIGNVISIQRSVPITLKLNGLAEPTRTLSKTVGDFLKEKGLTLSSHDSVSPAAVTPIVAGETISVVRDGTGIQSTTQQIPMPIQYIADNSLAYGTSAVRQAGSPGQRVLTYRTVVKDGKVVSQTLISSVVTQQPVTQIDVVGSNLSGIKGDMAIAGISVTDYQYADYIISHESGWCPTKAQGEYGGCPAYAGYVPSYGGYGLCQATPGIKMESAGADWATNPITQLRWCSGYAEQRYGSWYAAYSHWTAYGNW